MLTGLHHVTAISGPPQPTLDFWTGVLGLRFVKKTVNFDDPGTYHFYFGDGAGTPGTILTFFPWVLPAGVRSQGRAGAGQIAHTSFRVPADSIDAWQDRFAEHAVDFDAPLERFGERVLPFRDPDGLGFELVGSADAAPPSAWPDGPVPAALAPGRIHGVTVPVPDDAAATVRMLTDVLGFEETGRDGPRRRFRLGRGAEAGHYDLVTDADAAPGRMGIGAVHHVAWRVADRAAQDAWRARLVDAGANVTPVRDRQYFESIYFREPAGVLFEIATDAPGFAIDEAPDALGRRLMLPPWLEEKRADIEARLPRVRTP